MRLTLADIEAESVDESEPFEFEIDDGTVVTMPGPSDVGMDVLIAGADFGAQFKLLVGDETFERLRALRTPNGHQRISMRVINRIMERYGEHYGLGTPGEGDASPISSNRTARRSKQISGSRRPAKAS